MFGMLSSDDPIVKDRLETCEKCEHFLSTFSLCKKCGCAIRFKVLLEVADCPLNKWKEKL